MSETCFTDNEMYKVTLKFHKRSQYAITGY